MTVKNTWRIRLSRQEKSTTYINAGSAAGVQITLVTLGIRIVGAAQPCTAGRAATASHHLTTPVQSVGILNALKRASAAACCHAALCSGVVMSQSGRHFLLTARRSWRRSSIVARPKNQAIVDFVNDQVGLQHDHICTGLVYRLETER
jgi:hypothetical protein